MSGFALSGSPHVAVARRGPLLNRVPYSVEERGLTSKHSIVYVEYDIFFMKLVFILVI